MPNGLMSIGMFSRSSLLSIKALRAYHAAGILVPARIAQAVDEIHSGIEHPASLTPVHIREEPAIQTVGYRGRVREAAFATFLDTAYAALYEMLGRLSSPITATTTRSPVATNCSVGGSPNMRSPPTCRSGRSISSARPRPRIPGTIELRSVGRWLPARAQTPEEGTHDSDGWLRDRRLRRRCNCRRILVSWAVLTDPEGNEFRLAARS
ncbi:MAG: hypothetical protein M3R66_09325 [Actinomycetota bacterium]|nr:hypothetical protein [Actinomycetota bacterium]